MGTRERSVGWMERVTGIGGFFFRTKDPAALMRWYTENLGITDFNAELWQQEAGPTVFAPFAADTDYFGRMDQQTMVNFRVGDLDAMLAQLRVNGANVDADVQDMDGVGRFAWVTDPEGNRIELWQPAEATPGT